MPVGPEKARRGISHHWSTAECCFPEHRRAPSMSSSACPICRRDRISWRRRQESEISRRPAAQLTEWKYSSRELRADQPFQRETFTVARTLRVRKNPHTECAGYFRFCAKLFSIMIVFPAVLRAPARRNHSGDDLDVTGRLRPHLTRTVPQHEGQYQPPWACHVAQAPHGVP